VILFLAPFPHRLLGVLVGLGDIILSHFELSIYSIPCDLGHYFFLFNNFTPGLLSSRRTFSAILADNFKYSSAALAGAAWAAYSSAA
jgi:hypothetical protein